MIVLFGGVEVLYAGLSIDYGTTMALFGAAPARNPASPLSTGSSTSAAPVGQPGTAATGGGGTQSGTGGPGGTAPHRSG